MLLPFLTACQGASALASSSRGLPGPPWKAYPRSVKIQNHDPFRFASAQSDGMVLQMAPAEATVWGFMPKESTGHITVNFRGKTIQTTDKVWMGNSTWTWIAKLPPTEGGLTEYNITATDANAGTTITLANVLLGDVWVCSGQSNMAYPLSESTPKCWNASNINCTKMSGVSREQCIYGCVQNSEEEIAAMANYPNMRLYQNTHGSSTVPLTESNNTGWLAPKDMGESFSAMCWWVSRLRACTMHHALCQHNALVSSTHDHSYPPALILLFVFC